MYKRQRRRFNLTDRDMPDIVISEFMDEAILRETFAGRDVLYDPTLVDLSLIHI